MLVSPTSTGVTAPSGSLTTDGSGTTSTVVADEGKLENPLLVLGPGNQPHLIWTRYRSEDGDAAAGP